MEGTHENEDFSFITIKAATLNVIEFLKLSEKHAEKYEGESDPRHTNEQESRDNRRDIDRELYEEWTTRK